MNSTEVTFPTVDPATAPPSSAPIEREEVRPQERAVARAAYNKKPTLRDVRLQWLAGWLVLLPFCGVFVILIRFVGRYRMDRLQDLRCAYREICESDRPLLICANHLTFMDSIMIIWACASNDWYVRNYRKFTWNLPAGDFFKKKLIFRVIAYLSKCLFIHRDGTKAHQVAILNLCRDLLLKGEVVTIFPEGKRSRSGRFDPDKLTYGVGKILSSVQEMGGDARVLCIYLRSDKQKTYSNYPAKGSNFHLDFKLIEPKTSFRGRAAYADLTNQIGAVIHGMEKTYFDRKYRTC